MCVVALGRQGNLGGGGGGGSKGGKSRRMFMQILNFDQTIEEVSK